MKTCVSFRSSLFLPFLPEDQQVNPECYGAELCWWLCRELATRNIFTSYPEYEDWGWFLEFIGDGNEFWICCGNVSGEKEKWQIYISARHRGLFNRKKPKMEHIKPTVAAISSILEQTTGIRQIEWREEI